MMMKSSLFPTILAILFTGLVHVSVGKPPYNPRDFERFLQRIQKSIADSSPDILPFASKMDFIKKLNETSNDFKGYCVGYDNDSQRNEGNFSPVSSLNKTIKKIFYYYFMSAKENKDHIRDIQFGDPVGFNAYLTKKNEDENSPTFLESVETFRNLMYRETDITDKILVKQFERFVKSIEENLNSSIPDDLPFLLKFRLVENLKKTSIQFKKLCLQLDVEFRAESSKKRSRDDSPISILNRAIDSVFYQYKESATQIEDILNDIESVDPIGLIVYLTKKKVSHSSPTFIKTVVEFETIMKVRVRLFNSRWDNSQIDIFKENRDRKLHEIPETIRERVTTEYSRFHNLTIDFFNELAMETLPNIKMYSLLDYKNVWKYNPHRWRDIDDVQILYSAGMRTNHGPHAICIYYEADSQKVLVYDSSMYKLLDPTQQFIIGKLYPFNKGIVFKEPKNLQGRDPTCAVFAMIYATMLLLKTDPAKTEFKLNNVHGDSTLYMRLHILNMFANRKLALME